MVIQVVDDGPSCFPLQSHVINELYNLGGLGIDNQLMLVFRIFYIAIGGKGADVLPVAPLVIKYLADFL